MRSALPLLLFLGNALPLLPLPFFLVCSALPLFFLGIPSFSALLSLIFVRFFLLHICVFFTNCSSPPCFATFSVFFHSFFVLFQFFLFSHLFPFFTFFILFIFSLFVCIFLFLFAPFIFSFFVVFACCVCLLCLQTFCFSDFFWEADFFQIFFADFSLVFLQFFLADFLFCCHGARLD